MDLEASRKKVEALTAPRNAVLVGASDRPGSWAAGSGTISTRTNFPGRSIWSIRAAPRFWGRPCYPDFKSLPEPPDHMVILVPAAGVVEALRSGAAAGARSATVFSAGFGEGFNTEAAVLGRELDRGHRRDRARGVGPQLHGQYLLQEPARHADRGPRR